MKKCPIQRFNLFQIGTWDFGPWAIVKNGAKPPSNHMCAIGVLVFCNQIVFLEVNFELKLSCEFACVLQIEIFIEKGKIPRPFFHM